MTAKRHGYAAAPMTIDLGPFTTRLVEAGIETTRPLEGASHAAARAEALGQDAQPWVDAVFDYVAALHAKRHELWSAVHFVVEHVAAASADASTFSAALRELGALFVDLGDRSTRLEQYGVRFAAAALAKEAAADAGPALRATVQFARALGADRRVDPGWFLQLLVPPLWRRSESLSRYVESLASVEHLASALAARELSVGYPVAFGLAQLAEHAEGVATHWERWCTSLAKLGRSLRDGAYGTFEHGLSGLATMGLSADELDSALDVARTLADHGINPMPTLQQGFSSPLALALAGRLARGGIEPYFVLTGGLRAFESLRWMDDDGERLVSLAEAMHRAGLATRRLFEDGLPNLVELEQQHPGLALQGLELAEAMVARGLEPGVTLTWALGRVATAAVYTYAFVVPEALALARALVDVGANPEPAMSYAVRPLAELSHGDVEQFRTLGRALQGLVATLQRLGLDARDVLFHDVRSLAEAGAHSTAFLELVQRLSALLEVWTAQKLDPSALLSRGLPAAAREAVGKPWVLAAAFDTAGRLAQEGRGDEAERLLELGLGTALKTAGADEAAFRESFAALERRYAALPAALLQPASIAASALAGTDVTTLDRVLAIIEQHVARRDDDAHRAAIGSALPSLATMTGTADALGALIDDAFTAAADAGEHLDAWASGAFGATATVCRGQPAAARRLFTTLASRAAGFSPRTRWLFNVGAPGLASAVDRDGDALVRVLERLAALAKLDEPDELLQIAVPFAATARNAGTCLEMLDALAGLLSVRGTQRAALIGGLSSVRPMLAQRPAAWSRLVGPALASHRQHAGPLLSAFATLGARHLERDEDFDVLKELVTQLGVRALDAVTSLVLPAVWSGVIKSLAAHRDTLQRYLREVSIHDPVVYQRYVALHGDQALSEPERRARTQALKDEVTALTSAIRSGDVTAAQEASPLFGVALQHVFPPSVSATRDTYEALYRTMSDRPEDTRLWDAGPLAQHELTVASGAYQLRDGVDVDRSPWATLVSVLSQREADRDEPPAPLGWDLLCAWAEGRIGQPKTREALLARLVTCLPSQDAVSSELETASHLLALHELAADRLHGAVEACLLAARAEDGGRYDRLVREKLAPPPRINPGLVKSVAKTLDAWRAGSIDAAPAHKRLAGQLHAFIVDERAAEALRAAETLATALAALEPKPVQLEAAKEVRRVHADLLGQDVQAMHRVLFGDAETGPGCLEYRASSDVQRLVAQVTKRRAHCVAGLTEGVCVVHDEQLWNRPEFLQLVLWNEHGTCVGGVHLLVVEENGERFLTLPGINPTLALLELVDAPVLLDALVAHAWRLAKHWKLAGVWIPQPQSIHSNRRALHDAIAQKRWPLRSSKNHQFSYRPYAYSFDAVFAVPAPD